MIKRPGPLKNSEINWKEFDKAKKKALLEFGSYSHENVKKIVPRNFPISKFAFTAENPVTRDFLLKISDIPKTPCAENYDKILRQTPGKHWKVIDGHPCTYVPKNVEQHYWAEFASRDPLAERLASLSVHPHWVWNWELSRQFYRALARGKIMAHHINFFCDQVLPATGFVHPATLTFIVKFWRGFVDQNLELVEIAWTALNARRRAFFAPEESEVRFLVQEARMALSVENSTCLVRLRDVTLRLAITCPAFLSWLYVHCKVFAQPLSKEQTQAFAKTIAENPTAARAVHELHPQTLEELQIPIDFFRQKYDSELIRHIQTAQEIAHVANPKKLFGTRIQ